MIKVIPPGSYNDLSFNTAQLIKIASNGLSGNDLSTLIKRAGHEFATSIKNMSFDKGEVPIHLIALGATEAVGPNRNGDGFTKAACKKYKDTFTKHSRFYRNHKNKDTSKSYGVVKQAIYSDSMQRIELLAILNGTREAAHKNGGLIADEELEKLANDEPIAVSMAAKVAYDVCLPAGSPIETDKGNLPIETIKVGQLVRTHTGKLKPVKQTIQRQYKGGMTHLDILGVTEIVSATDNHPLLVVSADELRNCVGTSRGVKHRHTFKKSSNTCTRCKRTVTINRKWTEANELKLGDWVVYPARQPGNVSVLPAYAYLTGLYLGDGSIIWKRKGSSKNGQKRIRENMPSGFSVTIDNRTQGIISLVQKYAQDVHGRKQPINLTSKKTATTASIYNRIFAKFLLDSIGTGSFTKYVVDELFNWDRESRLYFLAGCLDSDGWVNRKQGYDGYGTGSFASVNKELVNAIQKLWWGLGVVVTKSIQYPTGFDKKTRVQAYVLTIPRSGTALLNGYAEKAKGVEQSNRSNSHGFFVDGYVHLPIKRIIRGPDNLTVYNLAVEEDESYISNIVLHNCSGCHNKARTRQEYCTDKSEGGSCKYGGLKHNIGLVAEDGHQLHADNPHPLFFDISKVFRGADRTAFVTGKVASNQIIGGAELAELLGVTAPFDLLEHDYNYGSNVLAQIKVARILADKERSYLANDLDRIFDARYISNIQISNSANRNELLSALAHQKIALSLPDWLTLVTNTSEEKCASVLSIVGSCLPTVFSDLIEDPNLADLIRSNPSRLSPTNLHSKWAAKYAADYSLARNHVQQRLWRTMLNGQELPRYRVKSAANITPNAKELAKQYGLYQIGFINYQENDSDIDLTTDLLVRQNQVY